VAFWRNTLFWHGTGTFLSLIVSFTAAGFSGLQWYEGRDQLLLSTKPHVDFDPDGLPVEIAVTNAGPGPAIIKSVVFYVDRKPVTDAEDAGNNYGQLSKTSLITSDWNRMIRLRSARR
jgi:hypothetical protein